MRDSDQGVDGNSIERGGVGRQQRINERIKMDEKTSNVLYFTLLRDLHALAFTTLLMQYRHAALLDLAIHGSTKHRELLRNRNRIQIIERCRDLIAPEPLGKKSSCAVLPRYQSTSCRTEIAPFLNFSDPVFVLSLSW